MKEQLKKSFRVPGRNQTFISKAARTSVDLDSLTSLVFCFVLSSPKFKKMNNKSQILFYGMYSNTIALMKSLEGAKNYTLPFLNVFLKKYPQLSSRRCRYNRVSPEFMQPLSLSEC